MKREVTSGDARCRMIFVLHMSKLDHNLIHLAAVHI